ncbi:MAG: glycosyltransferase family 1 protein [Patescibacteria group bacterium]|jgi:alpha-1,3-rhamnosyl/mannosyltransferase
MRIGIDCRTMLDWRKGGESAGIGHYTYYLVKHLVREDTANEYVLFLDKMIDQRVKEELLDSAKATVSVRNFPFQALKRCLPFVYGHMVISSMFEKAKLDLLHAPANALPMFYRRPAVVTVHDLAVYDHPEWFPMKYAGAALSFSERIVVPHSVSAARRVLAVSGQTKADLMRIFSAPDDKIDVIYEGAEPQPETFAAAGAAAVLKRLRLMGRRYCLQLGTLEPRKNLERSFEAFVALAGSDYHEYRGLDLIVAGRKGWHADQIIQALEKANSDLAQAAVKAHDEPRERIRYVGYLSPEDKVQVVANAAMFVFPSLYEGFGLPVIEAMSLGVPVIASRRASLPEICGEAALLVDPENVGEITLAMKKLYDDPALARGLSAAGRQRSKEFNWSRTARETVQAYAKAVNGA